MFVFAVTHSILKLEAVYEKRLVVNLKELMMFRGRHVDKLINFITQDIASPVIE